MTAKRVGGLLALTLALSAGGCVGSNPQPALPPAAAVAAPPAVKHVTYPVGLRVLPLWRGKDRPLPTLVFYPSALPAPAALTVAAPQLGARTVERRTLRRLQKHDTLAHGVLEAPPAVGRFPLVVFSHGLSGSPEWCAAVLASWASAGFVVVAPTFPYTSEFTRDYRREDIVNQPDDVRHVLQRVRRLDTTPGDPLRGRIDGDRVAAVGHSAGGYTTTGLFTKGHDPRLRAGVVMAGWAAPGAFAGPPAKMLFLQGTADPVVPMAISQAAFAQVPWTKSYLVMRRVSHANYLRQQDRGYELMTSTVTAFLRWTLLDDESARPRLPHIFPALPISRAD
ncbi:MAG: chlorophyllase [Actinoplanes sp.]